MASEAQAVDYARTEGASLLRSAIDEVNAEVRKQVSEEEKEKRLRVYSYMAYNAAGIEVGGAVLLHGPRQSEWVVSGVLSRTVMASPKPYAVRLELRGQL